MIFSVHIVLINESLPLKVDSLQNLEEVGTFSNVQFSTKDQRNTKKVGAVAYKKKQISWNHSWRNKHQTYLTNTLNSLNMLKGKNKGKKI